MNATDKTLALSRPLGVAGELGAGGLEPNTVYARRVILTGQLETLQSSNGKWCFLNSLRLLSRIIGALEVVFPDGLTGFEQEVSELIPTLWSAGTVKVVRKNDTNWIGVSAILNIGPEVRPDLPWTSILANGWVARYTSGPDPLPADVSQVNPLSCLLAASFGVTEIFKRVYDISTEEVGFVKNGAFSLFELSNNFDDCGPELPSFIQLPETLVLGGGAIGNGLTLLLSQLPLEGRILILDKQVFGVENFGTCTLLDSEKWINSSKAEMLAAWLARRSALQVTGKLTTIEDAIAGNLLNNKIDLVINGLDDIGARRVVQKLWPSLIVDGAINSAGAAVVTHSIAHRKFACLRCNFTAQDVDLTASQVRATGLSESSLHGNQNRPIRDEDIDKADVKARAWLRVQQGLGQTICSTVSAGIAQGLGLKLATGFRPSVPFVATASAALVIAQVLKNLLWSDERFVHEFQFASVFVGPETSIKTGRLAEKNCECTTNVSIIDRLIARRNG